MTIFGCGADSLIPLPSAGMRFLADLGFTSVRLPFYTSRQSADGMTNVSVILDKCASCGEGAKSIVHVERHNFVPTYDFSRLIHDVTVCAEAGFDLMLNPMWLPASLTGGKPTNEPYASEFQPGVGWHPWTKAERPEFYPPFAAWDTVGIYNLAAAAARAVGHLVGRLAVWNEPDIRMFLPQKDAYGEDWLRAFRAFYCNVVIPFVQGWRSVWPGVLFGGPDCSSPGCLRFFLQLEAEQANLSNWPRYDELYYHVYPDRIGSTYGPDIVARSLERIGGPGGYQDVIRQFPAHACTPQLVTEFADGDQDSSAAAWSHAILTTFPQIVGVYPLVAHQFVAGGPPAWDAIARWEMGGRVGLAPPPLTPNADGIEMRNLIAGRSTARRRSVKS